MSNTGTADTPHGSASPPGTPWRFGFWSLIVTQFQGAFSDNALKNLVIILAVGTSAPLESRHHAAEQITAVFSLPFILFSLAGGWMADRFSKRTVAVAMKMIEVGVMLFVLIGFALHNRPIQLVAVFMMGVHSALFSPSKYGLLPELLPEERLSWGNGVIMMGTNVAILGGTLIGLSMAQWFGPRQQFSGVLFVVLAVLGFCSSLGITRVPAANPAKPFQVNPFVDLWAQIRIMRRDRVLWLANLGNCYFWFVGALLLLNLFFYGIDVLGLKDQESKIGLLMAAVAVGIGLGTVAAGSLSGKKIEYGLVPLGSVGMTIFAAVLYSHGLSFNRTLVYLALLGFFGGFFVVPINALLQYRPNKDEKGGVLAATGLLSSIGVFLSSPVHYFLTQVLHLTPAGIFLAVSFMTLAATIYVLVILPDSFLRLVLWMLTHSIYRIRVEGRENVPEKGGALFVCNHVSFVDALLLTASTDRFVRCIMFKGIYDLPTVKPFAKIMRAIPISSQLRPREMIQSLREASEAIQAGEVVCIFAEGQITRIGQLLPFRRGFERIMKNVDAPIIPVCVDGVWGSIFSFERGRFLWKVPRYFPYPVTVAFGRPMAPASTPFEVRQAVQDLNADVWPLRRKRALLLHRAFVRKARHHPRRFFMADPTMRRLRMGAALTKTIFLARRLRPVWKDQDMVGILLPPSVPGALVNYAALLMGKVPVNLNYTLSNDALASCARQCGIQTVITSKAFLEKIKLDVGAQPVLSGVEGHAVPLDPIYIEDLAANPLLVEKAIALFLTWTSPVAWLEKAVGFARCSAFNTVAALGEGGPRSTTAATTIAPTRSTLHAPRTSRLDDPATVIFSSGSTGDPKGVVLTHFNIASNVEQLGQTFALGGHDRVLGILPFFHSFGFTGTLMLPAVLGLGAVYHPNPLDARAIGPLVRDYRVTFLLATPTFLQMYMRGCEPEDFGSLDFVMTGAEKLPDRVAQAFEDRFGIRPLEGYGSTECSPAVTVNTHDFRAAGFRQIGAKRGKIGHPLPGVTVRIVDPDTMQPLPVGQPGLLLVRGPNVMKGYLGKPEKTAEVLRDGWYVTGDVASLDEDGFLQITDRLTRFTKIGGEMVPHVKVEDKLHELAGATEQTFAVAGVPDEKKGERLIVLHTLADGQVRDVVDKLAACDLPNLWKPRPDQFFRVESLPHLGTGKLDLRKVKETAARLSVG